MFMSCVNYRGYVVHFYCRLTMACVYYRTMKVLRGKDIVEMSAAELQERVAGYRGVVLDIGTGDGKFVYRLAPSNTHLFYIGVDASAENLSEYATRIARKPARGGRPNVLYVLANVEAMPAALDNLASSLHINFPWGSLLKGLATGDEQTLQNIARTAAPRAALHMLINYAIFFDPVPLEVLELPALTDEYIDRVLTPLYARAGIAITGHTRVGKEVMKAVPTTWSKRLAYGRHPHTIAIESICKPAGTLDEDSGASGIIS